MPPALFAFSTPTPPADLRPVSCATRQVRPGLTVCASGATSNVPERIAAISASTLSRVRS